MTLFKKKKKNLKNLFKKKGWGGRLVIKIRNDFL